MERLAKWTVIVGIGTTFVFLLTGLFVALPVKILWNWLMPVIFNLPKITLWQALGLYLLTNVLFNSNASTKK